MKKLISILLITLTVGTTNLVNAQYNRALLKNKSGVYMNFANYEAQKLNLDVDFTKEKHKIRIHDFFNKSVIDVIHQGKKYTFAKKDIYGIRDGNGKDYRFFENKEFEILAADTIYLYMTQEIQLSGSIKNQKSKTIITYYFSKTGNSEIIPLTSENLKKVFPENHKMHYALDMMFKNENELTSYDSFHKNYKIIKFLKDFL